MLEYDQNKTDDLEWIEACTGLSRRTRLEVPSSAKEWYDRHWKTEKSTKFKAGDRVYVHVPTEKGASKHPKLIVPWSGPYRVIAATSNSATVTEIGTDKEPIQVPFDHTVKVPASIDDSPVVISRRSSRTDIATVDFRCPGLYEIGNQLTPCHVEVKWSQIADNPPLPDLVFKSVFELA
ncbi:hypothetical protein OSTOST_13773 [Ostertagia ostertagi]